MALHPTQLPLDDIYLSSLSSPLTNLLSLLMRLFVSEGFPHTDMCTATLRACSPASLGGVRKGNMNIYSPCFRAVGPYSVAVAIASPAFPSSGRDKQG